MEETIGLGDLMVQEEDMIGGMKRDEASMDLRSRGRSDIDGACAVEDSMTKKFP